MDDSEERFLCKTLFHILEQDRLTLWKKSWILSHITQLIHIPSETNWDTNNHHYLYSRNILHEFYFSLTILHLLYQGYMYRWARSSQIFLSCATQSSQQDEFMTQQIIWVFLLKLSLVSHYGCLIGHLQISGLTPHLMNKLVQISENYSFWLPELLGRQLMLQFPFWHFLYNLKG